jgi:hypothetical protein
MTDNLRFLILPWVRVPHMASPILQRVARRINYGHTIYLLETLRRMGLLSGICCQAANWVLVGQTSGRSRNGHPSLKVPTKDI